MTEAQEAALFEAIIVPHRSLSKRALNRLVFAVAALCTMNAGVFIAVGAWPVAGFSGIELFVATVLFRVHALGARASEMVLLTPSSLRISRTSPKGVREEHEMSPGWLRIVMTETPGRVPRLLLSASGVQHEIGRVLGEDEKRELARALEEALRRLRNPVFDNPQLG
jgi:uncharacterized membrane protein